MNNKTEVIVINYGSNRIKFTHHGYIEPIISWCRLYCGVDFIVYLRVEFFASGDLYGAPRLRPFGLHYFEVPFSLAKMHI